MRRPPRSIPAMWRRFRRAAGSPCGPAISRRPSRLFSVFWPSRMVCRLTGTATGLGWGSAMSPKRAAASGKLSRPTGRLETEAARLAKADADNTQWQRDLSVSAQQDRRRARRPRASLPTRSPPSRPPSAISERLAKADADNTQWQRDLSISPLQDRRRARGPGQARRRARRRPSRPRHRRTPSQGRRRQHRVAARPLRLAITRSATCSWPRASSPTRSPPSRPPSSSAERLAKADADNTQWQRDLSVSPREDRRRAPWPRASSPTRSPPSRPPSPSENAWPRPTPTTPSWQRDLSVSHDEDRRRAPRPRASSPMRSPPSRPPSSSPNAWPKPTPTTPTGSATLPKDLAWFDGEIAKLDGSACPHRLTSPRCG